METVEKSRCYKDNLVSYWLFQNNKDAAQSLDECLALLTSQLNGFLWQNDPFNLTLANVKEYEGSDDIDIPHLIGVTDYGDNVGDLWFITYLLKKLTLEIDGLVVKVLDSDGEFLLIEAADVLPDWVDPESSKNRVYIYKGELHIIPIAKSPADITPLATGVPAISAAVDCVRKCSGITRANDEIQNAINKRLNRYPEQAFSDIHSTTCYLPVPAAQLLTDHPQFISAATRAFYLRDPLDLKACSNMKHFPPENRINTKVRLTRCLYAQLMQQKFFPPKRSSWNIPPANDAKHKSHDLGMKIAFGFEILCASAAAADKSSSDDSTLPQLDEGKWANYLKSLRKYNYFQNEIEGSIKYKELLEQARQYFLTNQELSDIDRGDRNSEGKGRAILKHLHHLKTTEQELRTAEKSLTPDDDDSWLYMTYAELDNILEEYGSSGLEEDKSTADFDPTQLTDSMSAFINKQSNILSGAELPNSDELKFDGKGFLAAIERMMNGDDEKSTDSDDSSLDDYESDDSLTEKQEELHIEPTSEQEQSAKTKIPSQPGKLVKRTPPRQRVTFGSKQSAAHKSNGAKATNSQKKEPDPQIEDFMQMMDRELSKTHVGKSFEKHTTGTTSYNSTNGAQQSKPGASLATEEEFTDSDDEHEPVDVDLNTVKNLLESYNHQMGLPGPTSNLLESMGLKLPQNADE